MKKALCFALMIGVLASAVGCGFSPLDMEKLDEVYFDQLRTEVKEVSEISHYFIEYGMEETYSKIKGFENAKIYGKSKDCYICSVGYPLVSLNDGSDDSVYCENMIVGDYIIYDIALSAVTKDYKIYSLYEAYKLNLIDIDEVVNSALPKGTKVERLPDEVTLEKIENILNHFDTEITVKQIGFCEENVGFARYKFPVIGIFDTKQAENNQFVFCGDANVMDDDAGSHYTPAARYAYFDLKVRKGEFDKYYNAFVASN